ncbi:hypothetical protein MTO96_018058 [Rhipicephalus appendiculatus]
MGAPYESTNRYAPEASAVPQPSEAPPAMEDDPRRPRGGARPRLQVAEQESVPADQLARYGRMGSRKWPFSYEDSEEEVLLRETMMKMDDIGGFNYFGWLQSLKTRLLRATRRCADIEKRCRVIESSLHGETTRSIVSDERTLLRESPRHNHQREDGGENQSDQVMDDSVHYASLTDAPSCTWEVHPGGSSYIVTDGIVNGVRRCSYARHGGSTRHDRSRHEYSMTELACSVPSHETAFRSMTTYSPSTLDLTPERLDDHERDKERIRSLLHSITRNARNPSASSSPRNTN